MVKWGIYSKNPKYGKIGTAKVYSRIKILIAGVLMGLSAIFFPSFNELAIILALSAALIFVWDIFSQARSAIDIEKRISNLEKNVEESKDTSNKSKSYKSIKSNKILIILILVGFGTLFLFYFYFNSVNINEEDLGLSIYFLQNVTSVENSVISLDFIEKKMMFESTLFVDGDGIMLNSNSKGFQNRDENCNEHLEIISKDESSRSRTWHDDIPVSFNGFGIVDHIEMKKICNFEDEIIPNGKFTIHLFGKDQTEQAPLNNIKINTIFNSHKFKCRDTCIYANNFIMIDSDDKEGIRTITLQGNNPNTKSMQFDLRTYDIHSKNIANYLFIAIQIGIGVSISIIVYVFSSQQQKTISNFLDNKHRKENRRLNYLFESLEKYLPDIINLAEERNKAVLELHSQHTTENIISAEATVRWFELDAKHLEFLLIGSMDILEPSQIERFKLIVDVMNQIVFVHRQSNSSLINIKLLKKQIELLQQVTTNDIDWRDLPT